MAGRGGVDGSLSLVGVALDKERLVGGETGNRAGLVLTERRQSVGLLFRREENASGGRQGANIKR